MRRVRATSGARGARAGSPTFSVNLFPAMRKPSA
jgi:hypothetical protein